MIGRGLFHVKILGFEFQKRESLEVLVIVNIYFRFNWGGISLNSIIYQQMFCSRVEHCRSHQSTCNGMQDGYTCTNHSKNTSVYSYTHVHVHVSVQVLVHHQFNIVFADSNLHPFLEQINQIDENVTALEQAAYKLDNYSKRLGLFRVNCYCMGILSVLLNVGYTIF